MDWGAVHEDLIIWLIVAMEMSRGSEFRAFSAITGAISRQEWSENARPEVDQAERRIESLDDSRARYKLLGIERGATEGEIKRAYQKLAFEHHPDEGGDPERFRQATKAYELLIGFRREPEPVEPANWHRPGTIAKRLDHAGRDQGDAEVSQR